MTGRCISDIVGSGLCLGCGLCVSLVPQGIMTEADDGFLKPVFPNQASSLEAFEAVRNCCPGIILDCACCPGGRGDPIWGPVLMCCEGHATDEEVRFRASSGGAISALLCYLLASGQVTAVVHAGARSDNPLRNAVHISRTRDDVLQRAGSRYAPVAVLEEISSVLTREERVAFVGKPCDVAALRQLLHYRPEWRNKVGHTLSFFCAGQPSYRATDELLSFLNCPHNAVVDFWYRGRGWPGKAVAVLSDGTIRDCSYEQSWGQILGRQLHYRCKICPDGLGFFADVVCGDAWETRNGYPAFDERPGQSLLLARTVAGRLLLRQAEESACLKTAAFDLQRLASIQVLQKQRRQGVGARLVAVWMRGRRLPRYKGFGLWQNTVRSNWIQSLREFRGAWRRIASG